MTSVDASRRLWIGTYPAVGESPGSGEGVWSVDVDVSSGVLRDAALVAEAPSPSFLARHPAAPVLCSVTEREPGTVTTWRIAGDGELVRTASLPSGGDGPCHVAVNERALWVTNYVDGFAAAYGMSSDGEPVPDHASLHAGSGAGPVTDRQEGPHAHQVTILGDHVLVTDLGADVVRRYPLDPTPDDGDIAARLPAGTGPRHLVVLPSGALVVVGELDARVHVLVPDGDGWAHAGSVPVSPDGVAGEAFTGHVTLSADATRLHVGLRGPDVLSVHSVRDGAAPQVTHLADVALGAGGWPRHHEVVDADESGELLVVALQGTSELVSVRVARDGRGEVLDRVAWATPPSCVLVEP